MSFQSAGLRPAVLGSALALVFALSAGGALAQDAAEAPAPAASTPAAAASTAPGRGRTAATTTDTAAVHPGDATAGQAKAAVCGACHGMDGNSSDAQFPKLAGQSEQYIVRQLTDFKAGKRQNPIMMGMAAPLSEQDMHDLSAPIFQQDFACRAWPIRRWWRVARRCSGRAMPSAVFRPAWPATASMVAATRVPGTRSWPDNTRNTSRRR